MGTNQDFSDRVRQCAEQLADHGADAEQGERMGLIRFGSRVDVFVPVGSTVKVKVGDKPQAGVTVLAELPH